MHKGGDTMFTINGIEWNVVFTNPRSDNLRRSDGSLTCGVCDFGDRCIYLSDALRGAFLRKVYIHEVCHAAIFSHSIDLDIDQEEFLCDFIASFGDEIFAIVDDLFATLKRVA